MPLDVRCKGVGFVQYRLELGADVRRRRLDVVEPREKAAFVELDLGKPREIVVLGLLNEDPLPSQDDVERLAEARAGPGRIEALRRQVPGQELLVFEREALACLLRPRQFRGDLARNAGWRGRSYRHEIEGGRRARIASRSEEVGTLDQCRDVPLVGGEQPVECRCLAGRVSAVAAIARELQEGGCICGCGWACHVGSEVIMGTRARSGKTVV